MVVRVVLEFEDEALAKEFVGQALRDGITRENSFAEAVMVPLNVIGVFKRPTKYCDSGDGHRKVKSWTRGKKYGWWVCAVCGKPTEQWATGSLWPFSLGFNLLPAKLFPWAQAEGGWAPGVARWKEEDLGIIAQEEKLDFPE
jgi:hypothetical protein